VTTVKLSISGNGDGTDAPLVGELLDQIRDYFAMLDGVTASITGDDKPRFVWRVIDASRNSPLAFTAEAFPTDVRKGTMIIAEQAKLQVAEGIKQLQSAAVRPQFFSDNVLDAAERFIRRNTKSLSSTKLEHGAGQPDVVVTLTAATAMIGNLERIRESPAVRTYQELGSIEGMIQNVGTDHWGRHLLIIKDRLHGQDIRCVVEGDAHTMLEQQRVANVAWGKRRVIVTGKIAYRSLGRVSQAYIDRVEFLDQGDEPVQFADIIDRDFTAGLSSEEYLRKARGDDDA